MGYLDCVRPTADARDFAPNRRYVEGALPRAVIGDARASFRVIDGSVDKAVRFRPAQMSAQKGGAIVT